MNVFRPGKYLNVKCDIAFKRVFGWEKNKDILIGFLNDILLHEEGRMIVEVDFLPLNNPVDIFDQKESIVDVKCRDQSGKQYIVEMQIAEQEKFTNRLNFYSGKAYCTQLGKGRDYKNLKPVVLIAITDFVLFKSHDRYISRHHMVDIDDQQCYFDQQSYVVIELPKFRKERVEDLEGMIEKWCYFLKYSEDVRNEIELKSSGTVGRACEELEQFNWSALELEMYDAQIKKALDEKAQAEFRDKLDQEIFAKAEAVDAKAEAVDAKAEAVDAKAEAVEEAEKRVEAEAARIKSAEAEVKKAREAIKAEGELKAKKELAQKLLVTGAMNHEQISALTGLTPEEIAKLARSIASSAPASSD